MRAATFAFFVLGAAAAFAQRSLNPIGNNGNVINPGVPLRGPSPVVRGPSFGSMPVLGGGLPTLGGGLPTLGPLPPFGSSFGTPGSAPQRGFGGGRRGGGALGGGLVYLPMPVYGGFGTVHNPAPGQYDPIFGGYNPGVYPQPNSGYLGAYPEDYPSAPSSPTIIINQNFQPDTVRPVLRDYTNAQLPEPGRDGVPRDEARSEPPAPAQSVSPGGSTNTPIYLIAMKDHTIYPALAYWVENDTLHYVTMSGAPNRVSLSLVDRDLSTRLNDERGLSFRMPQQ